MTGLPVQADGDANDQLNRVGMCLLSGMLPPAQHLEYAEALLGVLQPRPGVYVRYPGGNPNTVSCDQLIPALAFWVRWADLGQVRAMWTAMWRRWGFAQNTRDGLGPSTRWKVPDLMVLRALPLFARGLGWGHYVADVYLLVLILSDYIYLRVYKDPVDINCTLATLYVCKVYRSSIISRFTWWLWPRLRPHIYADLQRYYRAEAGGNEWIAELWEKTIQRGFR